MMECAKGVSSRAINRVMGQRFTLDDQPGEIMILRQK
jgi:hypothetical protein